MRPVTKLRPTPDQCGGQAPKVLQELDLGHDFRARLAHGLGAVEDGNFHVGNGVHRLQQLFDVAVGRVEGYVGAGHPAEGEGETPGIGLADDAQHLVLLTLRKYVQWSR